MTNSIELNTRLNDQISDADLDGVAGGNWFTSFQNFFFGSHGIISNNGAGILSNNGANIISNNGAGILSNNGANFRH